MSLAFSLCYDAEVRTPHAGMASMGGRRGGFMREYTVVVPPDETGGYWTEVPALPGCGSQGETVEEALEMTKDAISLWLQALRARGEAVLEEREIIAKATGAA